ncbi:DNA-binding protein [Leptolyngbya sp. 'hensonii']|uniref:cold shock domain-containing protein n=1 Tax=Leptolyngbya sp. 'hensonii' TaxID=1922337 RepID=UPI00094F5C69|nr:cold shock domain-containing protein [Leptolyngbya sp. 'hensonii']OLP17080.1 DNA-binding protein [Leptolyngbya sp. 'hensonii']
MKPILQKGQLSNWKDGKGFGFIKPETGGKDVFLHISALKGSSRRPQVGDTILYELKMEADGKVRAVHASISGVPAQPAPSKRKPRQSRLAEIAISMGGLLAIALVVMELQGSRFRSPISTLTKPNCTIKGNISVETQNKVYHLPGMEDYNSTTIDLAKGEKWFCTEAEAIAAGWHKAPR